MTVPRHRSFPASLAPGIVGANRVAEALVELAAGASEVLDVRGCDRFTPWFVNAGGTKVHTYQPCDESGTVLPGSASSNLASGTSVTPASPYYLITADAGEALTIARN